MSSFAQLKKQRDGRLAHTLSITSSDRPPSAVEVEAERAFGSSFSSRKPSEAAASKTRAAQDARGGLSSDNNSSAQPVLTVAEHQRQIAAALDAAAGTKPDGALHHYHSLDNNSLSRSAAPFNPFVDRWTAQPVRAPLYSPASGSRSPSPALSSSSSSSAEPVAAGSSAPGRSQHQASDALQSKVGGSRSPRASPSTQLRATRRALPRSRSRSPDADPVIPPRPHDSSSALRAAAAAERQQSTETVDESTCRRLNEIYQLGPGDGVEVRAGVSGRGLYATKAFRPGSVVLARPPPIRVLATTDLAERCSHCLLTPAEAAMLHTAEEGPLLPCAACKVVHYCAQQCRDADMAVHAYECRALRRAKTADPTSPTPPESLRALARLGWTYHLRRGIGRAGEGEQLAREIRQLEHHLYGEDRSSDLAGALDAHTKQCMRVARSLVSFMALGLPTDDPAQAQKEVLGIFSPEYAGSLLVLVSAFTINTFSASSPSLDIIGAALNPVMAMSNHSCDPNAVVVFPKGAQSMRIVAIKPIEPGAEVFTHYIDIAQPRSARQSDLLETYHFTCRCALCSMDHADTGSAYAADARSALYHATCGERPKGLFSFEWERSDGRATVSMYPHVRCTACGQPWTDDDGSGSHLTTMLKRGQQKLDQDAKGELSDDALSELFTSIVPSLSTYMPPSSWPLLPLLRLAARCTPKDKLADVRRALGFYEQYCVGAKNVYTYGHPAAAIVVAEMAKTCTLPCEGTDVGEGLQRSLRVLGEAVKQCEIGFGDDGGLVGKEMRWLGDMCRGELARLQNGALRR